MLLYSSILTKFFGHNHVYVKLREIFVIKNMKFPVVFTLGSWQIPSHLVFELLAYTVAFRYLLMQQIKNDTIPFSQRSVVIIGGLSGAIVGTKILVVLQHIDIILLNQLNLLSLMFMGKTVVGGLIGGLIGVELTKKIVGIKRSTGDVFVYPLIIGTGIGRVGCFLTGLSDSTHGVATNLPWGVDFGDGIPRHPTQIYEIIFLIALMIFLKFRSRSTMKEGDLFKFYLVAYLAFRFIIDFLKPDFHYFWGLSAIQTACLITIIYYHRTLAQLVKVRLNYVS